MASIATRPRSCENFGRAKGCDHRRWGRRSLFARRSFGDISGNDFVVDGQGFFAGQTGDVGDGIFAGERIFGDVSGVNLKGEPRLGEEFAAAGRGRCKNQHIGIIAGNGGWAVKS
jgi:hypothetical protein